MTYTLTLVAIAVSLGAWMVTIVRTRTLRPHAAPQLLLGAHGFLLYFVARASGPAVVRVLATCCHLVLAAISVRAALNSRSAASETVGQAEH